MMTACAPKARWADVFCDRGAFSVDESRAILLAARDAGLELRLHGNQLGDTGGVALAVELDAGVIVALATDCNPGTSYVTNMGFVIALAVREMGMTFDEALWAATRGGAMALRRDDVGHLGVGARADFVVLDAPRAVHLAYRPGGAVVRRTERAKR
jgi:imidazolonepropionase